MFVLIIWLITLLYYIHVWWTETLKKDYANARILFILSKAKRLRKWRQNGPNFVLNITFFMLSKNWQRNKRWEREERISYVNGTNINKIYHSIWHWNIRLICAKIAFLTFLMPLTYYQLISYLRQFFVLTFQVSWVKADTRAIQAIGSHKITQNPRIRVMQEKRVKHHLIIINATLEEDGPYMCQLNTPSMKSQVCFPPKPC